MRKEPLNFSGGLLVNASREANLGPAFKMIMEELSGQYSIGYYPKNSDRNGTYRHMEVRVNRPGMHARTRQGH